MQGGQQSPKDFEDIMMAAQEVVYFNQVLHVFPLRQDSKLPARKYVETEEDIDPQRETMLAMMGIQ